MRLIRLYNSFYTGVMSTAFYVSVCLIRTIHYLTLHSFGKCFSPKHLLYVYSNLMLMWVRHQQNMEIRSKHDQCYSSTTLDLRFCHVDVGESLTTEPSLCQWCCREFYWSLVLYYVKYSNEVSYSLSPEKLILMTQFWVVITQNTQIPMCA